MGIKGWLPLGEALIISGGRDSMGGKPGHRHRGAVAMNAGT